MQSFSLYLHLCLKLLQPVSGTPELFLEWAKSLHPSILALALHLLLKLFQLLVVFIDVLLWGHFLFNSRACSCLDSLLNNTEVVASSPLAFQFRTLPILNILLDSLPVGIWKGRSHSHLLGSLEGSFTAVFDWIHDRWSVSGCIVLEFNCPLSFKFRPKLHGSCSVIHNLAKRLSICKVPLVPTFLLISCDSYRWSSCQQPMSVKWGRERVIIAM